MEDPEQPMNVQLFELNYVLNCGLSDVERTPDEGIQLIAEKARRTGLNIIPCVIQLTVTGNNRKTIIVVDQENGAAILMISQENMVDVCVRGGNLILSTHLPGDKYGMHIFKSHATTVEEAREGINRFLLQMPLPEPQNEGNSSSSEQEDNDFGGSSRFLTRNDALVEKEVQLVNRCLDEVEAFITRMQRNAVEFHAVKSKLTTTGKKQKKNELMLRSISRMVPKISKKKFTEQFKVIKLTLIILARLNGKMMHPNPVDILHSVFSALKILVNASRDPDSQDPIVARQCLNPLLSQLAVEFLNYGLNSDETTLWKYLGDAWIIPREQWQGPPLPVYIPFFNDGTSPDVNEYDPSIFLYMLQHRGSQESQGMNGFRNFPPLASARPSDAFTFDQDGSRMQSVGDIRARSAERDPRFYPEVLGLRYSYDGFQRNEVNETPTRRQMNPWTTRQHMLLDEARMNGLKICQVQRSRIGQSPMELTVEKGEVLAILDKNYDWWQVRNCLDKTGLVPNWLVREVSITN